MLNEISPQTSLPDTGDDTSPEERALLIERCLQAMEAGSTLVEVALAAGKAPSTVWRWIHADSVWILRYDVAKISRSRALMELALYEIQTANTLDEAKIAEKRAKMYLMHAGRLNPKEFSDKVHAAQLKMPAANGSFVFNLTFPQPVSQDMGALQVIAQPQVEDEG